MAYWVSWSTSCGRGDEFVSPPLDRTGWLFQPREQLGVVRLTDEYVHAYAYVHVNVTE
jgi:hypothetical protein